VVEHRLGRSRRVPVDASRDEHDEHPVAPRDRTLDDLAVVSRSRNDGDARLERVELPHALLAARADHLVTPIQRVLDHVLPELPRGPDDADPHCLLRCRPRSRFGRGGCDDGAGGLLCMPLDVEVRQPLEPARQVPVPLAEQLHRCGHEH
jgi:hypothetical protein